MGFFRRNRQERLAGHAVVVEAWPKPSVGSRNGAGSGNCKMKLELDVPGVPRQVVDHHELLMTENRWPEVGMRVAVTVDPDDPADVDADWDSVFGERLGGKAGVAAEWLGAAVGVDLDLSKGTEPRSAGPAPDYQEQIAALNARFAAGEITYEQMTDEIKRVLGAS